MTRLAPPLAAELAKRGAAAWPAVVVEPSSFVALIAEIVDGEPDPAQAASELHVEDLYLAHGCTSANKAAHRAFVSRAAHRAFVSRFLSQVPAQLANVTRSAAIVAEVQQELAKKLLVASDGEPPRIASYRGRGPLLAWLRVSALRTARSILRKKSEQKTEGDDALDRLPAREQDAELALLRRKYAAVFSAAFEATLKTLDRDARNILRLHYVDGASLDAVAKSYGISRATAARWIADAKKKIVDEVERRMGKELGSNEIGTKALLSLVQSQVDVSIRRHLSEK
jgi:RNA polymerase sigma-70 factor (ECF subfamily)